MSVRIMAIVWELDLTPVEKLVLLALADCANDEGLAWPSIATIQRKSNVGERTVQRSLRSLEAMGLIHRVEVAGKGCKYTINPRHSGTPARTAPVPESAQTPATVAPKPSRTINTIKREHVIADDWEPVAFSAKSQCGAIIAEWGEAERRLQVEQFTAHHRARGNRFIDWQSAWQTWVLNSRKWPTPKPKTPIAQNDTQSLARQILARRAAAGP